MWYGYLADLVVAFHLGYVSYVLVGQLIIWIGLIFRWSWIRNPWFRWTHLLAILVVALEAVCNITCPLTSWEFELRRMAGQEVEESTFVGKLFHNILFWDLPPWAFTTMYIGFAALVLGTFVLAPPRWRWRKGMPAASPT
ncbi:MAG TPA: DUF2784 domain-containing protein [Gemmataceae bacterium]|jgi:hypothetical protein|nr:DUF2784 domain-containing protein [Gemmataceae bacterium]